MNYEYLQKLYHHGIKGQKWGVRRSRSELLRLRRTAVIQDALDSGKITKTINPDKQKRHTQGPYYIEGRSYIHGDLAKAQELVDRLALTGTPVRDKKGDWTNKERVRDKDIIGVDVDSITKGEKLTKKALIIYSKTGAHIIPSANKKNKKEDG